MFLDVKWTEDLVIWLFTCFGLKHGQGLQTAQKRQGLPGAGKKEKQKTKKGGGDITAGRTNRSHSGFSVIHRKPPQ